MDTNTLILAKKIYDVINTKKLISIEMIDVHQLTSLTDLFIIVTADNIKQTQAIADAIELFLIEEQVQLRQKEGYLTAKWILLDYGCIIIHVLHQEEAKFYALNRLWKDGKLIDFS